MSNIVDTPRKSAWCQQVNQPGFIPTQKPRQSVRLKTVKIEPGQFNKALHNARYGTPL